MVFAMVAVLASAPRQLPAELLVKGTGRDRVLIRSQFSQNQQGAYDLFARRCTKCHYMARVIDALQTGVAPITRSKFDEKAIPKYVIKMLRKGKSGINKNEGKEIIELLLVARRLAQQPGPSPAPAPRPRPDPSPSSSPAAADAGPGPDAEVTP